MNAKACMLTSVAIFAVSIILSIVSNFLEGYMQLWISLTACLMLVPGWVFNIIGWIKLIKS